MLHTCAAAVLTTASEATFPTTASVSSWLMPVEECNDER